MNHEKHVLRQRALVYTFQSTKTGSRLMSHEQDARSEFPNEKVEVDLLLASSNYSSMTP